VDALEFDVYGRFRVRVSGNEAGFRRVDALGSDGKLHRLGDVIVPVSASTDDVVVILEAVFHEMARPGTEIRRVR
jgi:hypothetical protein